MRYYRLCPMVHALGVGRGQGTMPIYPLHLTTKVENEDKINKRKGIKKKNNRMPYPMLYDCRKQLEYGVGARLLKQSVSIMLVRSVEKEKNG